jgi:hypothetical protein
MTHRPRARRRNAAPSRPRTLWRGSPLRRRPLRSSRRNAHSQYRRPTTLLQHQFGRSRQCLPSHPLLRDRGLLLRLSGGQAPKTQDSILPESIRLWQLPSRYHATVRKRPNLGVNCTTAVVTALVTATRLGNRQQSNVPYRSTRLSWRCGSVLLKKSAPLRRRMHRNKSIKICTPQHLLPQHPKTWSANQIKAPTNKRLLLLMMKFLLVSKLASHTLCRLSLESSCWRALWCCCLPIIYAAPFNKT